MPIHATKRIWLTLVLLLLAAAAQAAPAARTQVVEGTVRDRLTGQPLAAAQVISGKRISETDETGRFRIESNQATLIVRRPGYLRQTVPVQGVQEIALDPFEPRALYLSFHGAGYGPLRRAALELIEKTELNAVVIDVKGDRGLLSYPSQLLEAHDIGAQQLITLRNLDTLVAELRERGIYTIARVVVFKDDRLASACPPLAIDDGSGQPFVDREKLTWADPFRKEVWDYNIAVAEEVARLGFDEIQFDYVRFPEQSGLVFSRESTRQGRVEAISGFLREARRRLLPYGVYLSADIFGYVCWNRDDTGIGQELTALAPYVDYLAPMLYPSGFSHGIPAYRNPVANPYEIIYYSLVEAQSRTGLEPLRFRPWLQAFKDYAFDRRRFGDREIRAQIAASKAFKANGYMLWNAANVYSTAGLLSEESEELAAEVVPAAAGQAAPGS